MRAKKRVNYVAKAQKLTREGRPLRRKGGGKSRRKKRKQSGKIEGLINRSKNVWAANHTVNLQVRVKETDHKSLGGLQQE